MEQNVSVEQQSHHDFFISYVKSDEPWAEWIATQLEQDGYTVIIEAWDFRPGDNLVVKKDQALRRAERTLLVLSPDYLQSDSVFLEWAAALHNDPLGLLPIIIQACQLGGLLGPIIPIDLIDLEKEAQARTRLLEGIRRERVRPTGTLAFPGSRFAAFPGPLPTSWNVPHTRNPFFIGRESELQELHKRFQEGNAAAIGQVQAISGLGGVGKTQLAVAYAYRYYGEYEHVLWVNAQDLSTLTSSFTDLAHRLDLPEKDTQEQEIVTQAVKVWLQRQGNWLLILDNADQSELLPPFLPTPYRGHLLITTRTTDLSKHVAGLDHPLAIDTFTEEEGALYLLQRSGLLPRGEKLEQVDEQSLQVAREISSELGGLPLALGQAGAYMKAESCSLVSYQKISQSHREILLQEHHIAIAEYPEPVARTWQISFQKVAEQNPAAADLLHFCAFLAPDAIPEDFIANSAFSGEKIQELLQDEFLFNKAIFALRTYSLIDRDPQKHVLTVHRLVQIVIRNSLSLQEQNEWKYRVVTSLSLHILPLYSTFETWSKLDLLLPHAMACITWVEQGLVTSSLVGHLFAQTGNYLFSRARYTEAERLYLEGLAIQEYDGEQEEVTIFQELHFRQLADHYIKQGKYDKAEKLLQRALAAREQDENSWVYLPMTLNQLARLYMRQGKYKEAEPLYQRLVTICEQRYSANDIANALTNLAQLYQTLRRYDEAESLLLRALQLRQRTLDSENTANMPGDIEALVSLYREQGRYDEAELFLQQTPVVDSQALEVIHPDTITKMHSIAALFEEQQRYEEAEDLYQRAVKMSIDIYGDGHPEITTALNNLAIHIEVHGAQHFLTQKVRESYALILERGTKLDTQSGAPDQKDLDDQTVTMPLQLQQSTSQDSTEHTSWHLLPVGMDRTFSSPVFPCSHRFRSDAQYCPECGQPATIIKSEE